MNKDWAHSQVVMESRMWGAITGSCCIPSIKPSKRDVVPSVLGDKYFSFLFGPHGILKVCLGPIASLSWMDIKYFLLCSIDGIDKHWSLYAGDCGSNEDSIISRESILLNRHRVYSMSRSCLLCAPYWNWPLFGCQLVTTATRRLKCLFVTRSSVEWRTREGEHTIKNTLEWKFLKHLIGMPSYGMLKRCERNTAERKHTNDIL